ncbi:MAG: hypothetical protein H8E21_12865 [Gammaproteobacteria bacterium]|nr:hypothetical protein [Gammaproteobacteria bacterium]MBL7000892.1 hypothetical protein [Gammaproteobacteria bacterium]
MNPLAILHQDEHIIVIHKPAGLLMHRSPISRDTVFVLQTLRNQIGQRVYPIHRLDRATSGVLAFGMSSKMAQIVTQQFEHHLVEKEYRALVRGWVDDSGQINHPVSDEDSNKKSQEAITDYRCLQKIELPYAVDRYSSARYSLVSISPRTGRRQQIRKHFKHISHHLIGDTTHGNGKHNQFFREQYGIHRLMLSSHRLCLDHPVTRKRLCFKAEAESEWEKVFEVFNWQQ